MVEIVRYSMVRSYRRCPRQFWFKYRRNIQRKKPLPPLLKGTILHEMLDQRAKQWRPMNVLNQYQKAYGNLLREEQELYGDLLPEMERIYTGYDRRYAQDGWKYEASEELLQTELTKKIRFVGHLDKRVIADSRRWIVDHKCKKDIPGEEERFNDYQILLYLWAHNRESEDKAEGIIWDYLRTKAPRVPEELKKGGLSQAKNIDTDYETYTRELRRLRIDPTPYREFLADLKERSERKFFVRIQLPAPSKEQTDNVVNDFIATAETMLADKKFPRSLDRSCSWCEYSRICGAQLRGLDASFIEKSEYEEREVEDQNAEED